MVSSEPIYDLAHLAHVEVLTPKPEASLKFFVDAFSSMPGHFFRQLLDGHRHLIPVFASKPGRIRAG